MTGFSYGLVGSTGRMGGEIRKILGPEACVFEASITGQNETGTPKVIFDFSRPEALELTLAACRRFGCALVLGTTGLSDAQRRQAAELAKTAAVVQSANFSLGIAVLSMILADYGPLLSDWDCEIVEAHHKAKKDAPSGTALALKKALGRDAVTHSLRVGGVPGDHICVLASEQEVLTLSHRAIARSVFAAGAVRAGRFAASARPGLYSFIGVLQTERERNS